MSHELQKQIQHAGHLLGRGEYALAEIITNTPLKGRWLVYFHTVDFATKLQQCTN